MKTLYYLLFGFFLLSAFSMIMQVASGKKEIDASFIFALAIIGILAYFFINKAIINPIDKMSANKISDLVPTAIIETQTSDGNPFQSKTSQDSELLKQESLDIYDDVLKNERCDSHFKEVINKFLIPYRISLIKYTLNKEFYFSIPYLRNSPKTVSASLRDIIDDSRYKVKGYPDWFYIAFPDVVKWAISDGWPAVKYELSNIVDNDLLDGDFLKFDHLNKIIHLYIRKVEKPLETRMWY